LHAVLDEFGVQTPAVRVNIAFSTGGDEGATRDTTLQRYFDGFPVVIPNAEDSAGTYHWVGFHQ